PRGAGPEERADAHAEGGPPPAVAQPPLDVRTDVVVEPQADLAGEPGRGTAVGAVAEGEPGADQRDGGESVGQGHASLRPLVRCVATILRQSPGVIQPGTAARPDRAPRR